LDPFDMILGDIDAIRFPQEYSDGLVFSKQIGKNINRRRASILLLAGGPVSRLRKLEVEKVFGMRGGGINDTEYAGLILSNNKNKVRRWLMAVKKDIKIAAVTDYLKARALRSKNLTRREYDFQPTLSSPTYGLDLFNRKEFVRANPGIELSDALA